MDDDKTYDELDHEAVQIEVEIAVLRAILEGVRMRQEEIMRQFSARRDTTQQAPAGSRVRLMGRSTGRP